MITLTETLVILVSSLLVNYISYMKGFRAGQEDIRRGIRGYRKFR